MRLPFKGLTAVPVVLVAALASASCSHRDDSGLAADVARPEAVAGAATSLYPPMQKDPAHAPVHEYY